MFENYKVYEIEYGGKKMTFETGKMCCLSNASILVRWGETVVLCNVTASTVSYTHLTLPTTSRV